MKKTLCRNFIIAAIYIFIIAIASPCFADFRFVVIGDSRGEDNGINKKIFGKLLEQIKLEEPAFVVITGDLITGSVHTNVHRERLKLWKDFTKGYGIPFYITIGNHEIESEGSEDIVKDIFEMPQNGPDNLKELIYSFDYENAHFVILDTDIYGDFHRLGKAQLEWLIGDLKNNDKETIFVFGHEPAFPMGPKKGHALDRYPAEKDRMWEIFKEYGVDIYFCSHEHLYNKAVHEYIYQIITGGSGASLHVAAENGGFYHFVVVDVTSSDLCEIIVKDVEGNIKDNFKIQAN